MPASIQLRGVSKRFGRVSALHETELTVQAGEFLTLLGPSGCGKTTLLRLIGGFERPDTGSVWIGGQEMTEVPAYRRPVNTVFQSYALFPHLSVFDNVAFGLRMQKVARPEIARRATEALSLVGLDGLEVRRPHQLSGGQRQRVALARALICRPQVLLLDEPLAALDAKLRHAMQLELKALQRRVGLTFIFVTHDQQEALAMSDRIALLSDGRIEQIGSAQEIYFQPRTAFVADFIGRANLIRADARPEGPRLLRCVSPDGTQWLVAAPAGTPPPAGPVTLVIRPERIELAAAEMAGPNVFPATVVDTVFKGSATEVALAMPSGQKLNASAAAPPAVGAQVWCRLQPGDIVVLR